MAYELIKFADEGSLAKAVAGEWLRELQGALKRKAEDEVYGVALSGGRVAKTFFSEIVRQMRELPGGGEGLKKRLQFFWADERCVPPSDPENNYRIARELLLEPLGIAEEQIHRLRGEENEADAVRTAEEEICAVAPLQKGKGPPVLDMVFLGMGEDGHVASLFPGERPEVMSSPAIYRLVTAVKPPPRRITIGYGVLAAAEKVWVLASGAGKEQALRESFSPQGKTPLARVLRSREQTKIFTDVQRAG